VPTALAYRFSAVSDATDLVTGALRDFAVESRAGGEMVGQADNEFRPADRRFGLKKPLAGEGARFCKPIPLIAPLRRNPALAEGLA
jgi:hypothetical protein